MNGKLANEFKEKIPLLNHSDVSACLLGDRGGVRKGAAAGGGGIGSSLD